MTQPPVIPQYLLWLSVLLLVVGVPLSCAVPINIVGCQPSIFPLNPDRQPIFPLRPKKKHVAPSENPASKESSTPTGAASSNLPLVAAESREVVSANASRCCGAAGE